MTWTTDPIKDELVYIEAVEINEDEVRGFGSEGDFVAKSVDLLIEVGSYVSVAASLYRSVDMTWNRDEAVLGGHMIRLYKLIDALLDQTCKNRRETSFAIARLVFECIVNLRYLVTNSSEELFRIYRLYSLQHELRLLKRIETNVKAT